MNLENDRHSDHTGKRDLVIYDQPGWNSFTYNFPVWGGIRRNRDGIEDTRAVSANSVDNRGAVGSGGCRRAENLLTSIEKKAFFIKVGLADSHC